MTATERRQLLPRSLSLPSLCLPQTAPFSYSSQAQFKRLFARQLCVNLHLHGAVNATQTRSRTRLMEARSSMQPLPIHPLPLPPVPPSASCCTRLYVAQLTFNCKTNTTHKTVRNKTKKTKAKEKTQLNLFYIFSSCLCCCCCCWVYDMIC